MTAPERARALVIVPTYNERSTIVTVANRLFEGAGDSVALLVVDDASADGTADAVEELAGGPNEVHVMRRAAKLGLGSAYVDGFRWALGHGYWAAVEMDADLSHDPGDVVRLLDALERSDLVVGSRYVRGGRIENWGLGRRLLSRAGNLYARAWLGFGVRDSTSGFRAYSAAFLRNEDLDAITAEGYAFQIEMTRRAALRGARIAEIPITFVERAAGRSKMSRRIVIEALVEVARWGVRDRAASLRRRKLGRKPPHLE